MPIRIAVVFPALLLAGAAQSETASTDAVYACAGIEADAERLACYDDAVGRLKAAEAAGEVTTVTRSDVETVQRETFGFAIPSLPSFGPRRGETGDAALDSVVAGVSKIDKTRYDKLVITLETGQVWVQTDSKLVSYSRKRGVDSAEIKRAAFGSFKMKLDGGPAFRVKRVE